MLARIRLVVFGLLYVLLVACAKERDPVYYYYHHDYHTVLAGETLYSISWHYELDYKRLAAWNGIRSPYIIYPGQRLHLTGPPAASKPRTEKSKLKEVDEGIGTGKPKTSSKNKVATAKSKKTASKPARHGWGWPTRGKVIRTYSAKDRGSKGIDIAGKEGQAVLAASSGEVVYSGDGLLGYGNLIIVKHNDRFLSAYAHNRKLLVAEGSNVKRGQKIAELGRSGTHSPKLHFEIRRDGKPVDPLKYLPKR